MHVVSLLQYKQSFYWPKKSKICRYIVVSTLYHTFDTKKSMKPLFPNPGLDYGGMFQKEDHNSALSQSREFTALAHVSSEHYIGFHNKVLKK